MRPAKCLFETHAITQIHEVSKNLKSLKLTSVSTFSFQADFTQSNHRTLQDPDEEEENDESVDQVKLTRFLSLL